MLRVGSFLKSPPFLAAVLAASTLACNTTSSSKGSKRGAGDTTVEQQSQPGTDGSNPDIQIQPPVQPPVDGSANGSGGNPGGNQVLPPVIDTGVMNSADCYKGDEFLCKAELACLRQTNERRGDRGELQHSAKFAFVARLWSKAQADRGFIGHAGFPYRRQEDYKTEFGSGSFMMSRENVAYSGSSSSDPEEIARMFTTMWWNSWGHRANMLANSKVLGCGIWKEGNTYYATQIFGEE